MDVPTRNGTESQGQVVDLVRVGVGLPSLRTELRNQIYLGSEQFVAKMQKHIAADVELAGCGKSTSLAPIDPAAQLRRYNH